MRVWIWVVWIVLLVASAVQVSRTPVVTDASSFLPGPANATQALMMEQLRDGLSTRIMVIGLQLKPDAAKAAPSAEQTAALVNASRALRSKLASDRRFAWVSNGDLNELGVERDRVFAARYLLSKRTTEEQFSTDGLARAFVELEGTLVSAQGAAIKSIATADPTLTALQLLEKASRRTAQSSGEGVWLGADGTAALVLVETEAKGHDIAALTQTIQFAQASADEVLMQWPAGLTKPVVEFAGSGYFNVLSHDAIGKDAMRLSLVAIFLVASLLLWALRSPRFLILAVIPVASGALAGFAVVGFLDNAIHGITLAFGVTLIGEAVDYAIYTFVQADENGQHSQRFWRQVFLAMLTSLIGFAAMYLSGFAGLKQLGLFSMVGLVVAAACARWLLPALLPRHQARDSTAAESAVRFSWLSSVTLGMRRLRWLVLLVAAAMSVLIVARYQTMWQDSLDALSSSSSVDTARDLNYRASIGVPDLRTMIAVQGSSLEQALQRTEATSTFLQTLVADQLLDGFESPSDLLPSFDTQKRRQSVLPTTDILRARVAQAASAGSLSARAFEPFIEAIAATRNGPLIDIKYYEKTILGAWLDSQIIRSEQGATVLMLLDGARSNADVKRRIMAANLPGVDLIDLKADVEVLVAGYRERTMRAFLFGCAGIFLVLLIQLRRRQAVLSMIATIVSAVVITSGLLLLIKSHLTLFNLVSVLLVVGVASNYTLFFSTLSTQVAERQRSSVSVLLAAASTFIGFAVLAFSSTPVLAMIGLTVSLGAVVGLVASMAFSIDAIDQA
jgi:predicted exporter